MTARTRDATLRDATSADVGAVAELERVAIGDPWSEAMVAAEMAGDGRIVLVATADRRVVGWAAFRAVGDEAELLRIAVDPGERRHGLGDALLATGLERVAAAGVTRCFLEVRTDNAAAIALYRRHGFNEVGRRRRYYPDRADALLFAIDVTCYPGGRSNDPDR